MLSKLSYVVPTIGRISIGEIVENKDGRRLPSKINHFRITAQHKRDGQWVEHPVAKAVAQKQKVESHQITEIPVKVMFNDPELTVRERWEAIDNKGRIVCAGNGETAKRIIGQEIQQTPCPGADVCEFGQQSRCDLMVRANFQIDVEAASFTNDEMSAFILRSRGFNTAKTLNRKLNNLAKLLKGKLVGVPFILKLRQKSSPLSRNTPFFYVDLVSAVPLLEAAKLATAKAKELEDAGLDQEEYEKEVKRGLDNGPFEDSPEEAAELEEFLLTSEDPKSNVSSFPSDSTGSGSPLTIDPSLDQLRQFIEGSRETAAQGAA